MKNWFKRFMNEEQTDLNDSWTMNELTEITERTDLKENFTCRSFWNIELYENDETTFLYSSKFPNEWWTKWINEPKRSLEWMIFPNSS